MLDSERHPRKAPEEDPPSSILPIVDGKLTDSSSEQPVKAAGPTELILELSTMAPKQHTPVLFTKFEPK